MHIDKFSNAVLTKIAATLDPELGACLETAIYLEKFSLLGAFTV